MVQAPALIAASVFVAPIPPRASDSIEIITAYFADHRAVLLVRQYLVGFFIMLLRTE